MTESTLRTDGALESQPKMGVRNLHNFIYCPRLFYFQWVENIFQENAEHRCRQPTCIAMSMGRRSWTTPKNSGCSRGFRRAPSAYSVFECPLDDLRLAKLKAELQPLLDHDEDQVLFVSLGPSTGDAMLIIDAMGLPYEVRSRLTIV